MFYHDLSFICIVNYFSSMSWSGPHRSLLACTFLSLSMCFQDHFHACRPVNFCFFESKTVRVKSVPHVAPTIPIPCPGWSLIEWMERLEFFLHSSTAAASLALNLLSRSRHKSTSTYKKFCFSLGQIRTSKIRKFIIRWFNGV